MQPRVQPFLMFQGNAEETMRFYVSLFPDGEVLAIKRYGPGEAGAEGAMWTASFSIGKLVVKCIDSPLKHDFSFTPSFSPRPQGLLSRAWARGKVLVHSSLG